MPHGECTLGLGFAQHTPALCTIHCSPGNTSLPNPKTLDEYTPHQYWSANIIIGLSIITQDIPGPDLDTREPGQIPGEISYHISHMTC